MSNHALLEHLASQEDAYEPSAETKGKLASKSLLALIGPTAIGKSTLAKAVEAKYAPLIGESTSITTRNRRNTDPAGYLTADEGYTLEKVAELIQNKALTHYIVNPNGSVYANLPDSFPFTINLQPAVPASLEKIRKAGFKAVHYCYLYTNAATWSIRLHERKGDSGYEGRLEEAMSSLQWALTHADSVHFISTAIEDTADSIEKVHSVALGKAPETSSIPDEIAQLLAVARAELTKIG